MKISTHQMFERASQQMSQVQNSLAKSQAELSQGKQVLNPSDAPDQAATIQRTALYRIPLLAFHLVCSVAARHCLKHIVCRADAAKTARRPLTA